MKIRVNDRNRKIYAVDRIIRETPGIDLNDTDGQLQIVRLTTYRILQSKLSKDFRNSNRGRYVYTGSSKTTGVIVDAYERALSAVILYLYLKNIKSNIGYVYAITNPAYSGYVKIGYSQDAESRLGSYQTGSPFRDYVLEMYTISENARLVEQTFLDRYTENIVNGEWVKLTCDVKEFFKTSICKNVCLDLGFPNRFNFRDLKGDIKNQIDGVCDGPFRGYDINRVIDDFYSKITVR